jgi:hypothetical protein
MAICSRWRAPCGVVFGRWMTPEDTDRDLLVMALRN